MPDEPYDFDREDTESLRERAMRRLKEESAAAPTPQDPQRLIEELQIHQVELQLQNDELRRSQQDLQEARNRYFNLFDQAPAGFAMLGPEARLLQANHTFCELVGQQILAMRDRPFVELVHPDDRDVFLARFPAFFRDPREKFLELRLLTKDEQPLVGRLAARRVDRDSGTEVIDRQQDATLLVSVHDITARCEAEARNQKLEEQLRQVQKLESFGLFAGGIAHEFNNMLMSVVGYCDLAHWELPAGHTARTHLEMALRASGNAADICRQLLAYAGQGKVEHRPVDLGRLARELLPMLQVSVGPLVRLELDIADEPIWVSGESGGLQQVVTNLVTNAAESYNGTSGVVKVVIGRRDFTNARLAAGATPHPPASGTLACLEVVDAGAGMDATTCQRIFDPFYSTRFTGRGLGMAVVLGIVRGHGGTILIDSKPGRGSSVKVALPLQATSGEQPESVVGEDGQPVLAAGATVLLIDDDERILQVGQSMLQSLGLQPLLAADGPAGVEVFRERHQQISCVLLDLMMPSMSGVEVLEALRAIDPLCRIVIITGYHEASARHGLKSAQADAIILKPFRLIDLRNVLASLMSR